MIEPYYQDETITLYNASSEDVLPQLSGIHACVTDPPYGISFMGKKWDYDVPTVELWRGVLNEEKTETKRANFHPTVKPTNLMRYLCRLATPKGGVILDPFMGSGSTGKAAVLEGFRFIGIEQNEEFCKISLARILYAKNMKQNGQLELDF